MIVKLKCRSDVKTDSNLSAPIDGTVWNISCVEEGEGFCQVNETCPATWQGFEPPLCGSNCPSQIVWGSCRTTTGGLRQNLRIFAQCKRSTKSWWSQGQQGFWNRNWATELCFSWIYKMLEKNAVISLWLEFEGRVCHWQTFGHFPAGVLSPAIIEW